MKKMTNAMNKENKNVITGKQMVEYLVLVAISLLEKLKTL